MIFEIFKAAVHSVGTAATMTAAGVYLHRRGMITPETKTGMARYTQQIAIPCLFFTIAIDCPQDHSSETCPNIMDHLRDAWVLLVWPIYVLLVGCLVGHLIIQIVQPPTWQRNCVLASTAFANAMGMPITLLDVIGHNFVPPGNIDLKLNPSSFQSIYVILNPVLQWGLGGWLLSPEEPPTGKKQDGNAGGSDSDDSDDDGKVQHTGFLPLRRNNFSIPSLEDAGFNSVRGGAPSWTSPADRAGNQMRRNLYSIPSLEDAGYADEKTGLIISTSQEDNRTNQHQQQEEDTPPMSDYDDLEDEYYLEISNHPIKEDEGVHHGSSPPPVQRDEIIRILSKIGQKAMQPPAIGAMVGFLVASIPLLRGLFVSLSHRDDNAPFEWIFDGILALAKSAIPVNMCVVGVNLSIAAQRQGTHEAASHKTIAAVVIGKMLIMPLVGVATVSILKMYFWNVPEEIEFQFYLVLLMNFITPTANVVMVIAELGSGSAAKNVMASLIGAQYIVAPFVLSLTVMLCVWTAVV